MQSSCLRITKRGCKKEINSVKDVGIKKIRICSCIPIGRQLVLLPFLFIGSKLDQKVEESKKSDISAVWNAVKWEKLGVNQDIL